MMHELSDNIKIASLGLRELGALKLFEGGNVERAKYLLEDVNETLIKSSRTMVTGGSG